jgi:threonine/homoserine/homoserine lactone efflux protein
LQLAVNNSIAASTIEYMLVKRNRFNCAMILTKVSAAGCLPGVVPRLPFFYYLSTSVLDIVVKGISFGLFMALSVGPTIFAVLKYSMSYGYKAGISYILGVSVSDFMFLFIANMAAGVLKVANDYQQPIGIAGGLLLIGMGIFGFKKKIKVSRSTDTIVPVGIGGLSKIAFSGFLMNTINPAVIFSWIGMTAVVADKSLSERVVLFGITLTVVLGLDVVKVLTASRVRKLLTPRNVVYLSRISALCLLGVGIFLLVKFLLHIPVAGH